jgi:hypothetical protein
MARKAAPVLHWQKYFDHFAAVYKLLFGQFKMQTFFKDQSNVHPISL